MTHDMPDWFTPLHARVADAARPMDPEPTGESPFLRPLRDIRALAFDVYGTLVISAAGDISLADKADRDGAIRDCLRERFPGIPLPTEGASLDQAFKERIYREHLRLRGNRNIPFPEVDIREIWADLLGAWMDAPPRPDDPRIAELALRFELKVNPVWGMPHWLEMLEAARGAGLPIGIASNAQFYTPVMLEALARRPFDQLGIDPAVCVWSYQERIGKPAEGLYRQLAVRFERQYRIQPEAVLYIGNDMRNDVAPAAARGFKTALFAGDARSLRLRAGDPLVGQTQPDVILTGLHQLREVVPELGH